MAHFKGLFKGIKLALVHFSYKPLLPSQIRPKAFRKGRLSLHFDTNNTALEIHIRNVYYKYKFMECCLYLRFGCSARRS